jgi:hypothetical protein
VASFLSDEWFAEVTQRWADVPTPAVASESATYVVIECDGAPASGAHALTLRLDGEGATVLAGDHLAASTVVRLSYDDAQALSLGHLDSATALREGRIKVSGDVRGLLTWGPWLGALLSGTAPSD